MQRKRDAGDFVGIKKQKVFSESLFQADKKLYARKGRMLSDFRQTLRSGAQFKNALLIFIRIGTAAQDESLPHCFNGVK
ncbi:MAG TPA: hypothetical protein VF721_23855 [Pyrinomonadaceae bacterium]|jgi:hypothetical protein